MLLKDYGDWTTYQLGQLKKIEPLNYAFDHNGDVEDGLDKDKNF